MLMLYKKCAAIAQLGERQTEELKVPGSIPGGGINFLLRHVYKIYMSLWPDG